MEDNKIQKQQEKQLVKKKELRQMKFTYAVRGLVFGLLVALIVFLLAADSEAYHQSEHTISAFIHTFTPFWVILFLPVVSAAAAWFISHQMSKRIVAQNAKIKVNKSDNALIVEFVENLTKNELNNDLDLDDSKNELGSSLKKLQSKLRNDRIVAAEREEKDKNRNWVTQGEAKFAEVLRLDNDKFEELSYNILRFLVDHVGLNQAGFFLYHNGDDKSDKGERFFEMTSFIAYDIRKSMEKRIEWGVGLVGRCGQEQKTIYITDLPKDYIHVTSGLLDGGVPRALLLVPLVSNDVMYGVIEVATLNEAFGEHEIEFLEKAAESIAITISNVKSKNKTNELLKEAKEKEVLMKAQEEKMRQSAEEMEANVEQLNRNKIELERSQIEMKRSQIEMKGVMDAIDHASISCQFQPSGEIDTVNENFVKTFGYTVEEMKKNGINILVAPQDIDEWKSKLEALKKGETIKGRFRRITKTGEEIWLLSTYSPVFDDDKVLRVISLENNISDQVKLEKDMQASQAELEAKKKETDIKLEETRKEVEAKFKEIEAVKIRNEKTLDGMLDAIITTDEDGNVEFFNVAAEQLWGYSRDEVLSKNVSMLFSPETLQSNDFANSFVTPGAAKETGKRAEVSIYSKYGEEVTVLMLLSEAEVDNKHSFTAFLQLSEIELF